MEKIKPQRVTSPDFPEAYFSVEANNFYSLQTNAGLGREYYETHLQFLPAALERHGIRHCQECAAVRPGVKYGCLTCRDYVDVVTRRARAREKKAKRERMVREMAKRIRDVGVMDWGALEGHYPTHEEAMQMARAALAVVRKYAGDAL